jgi:hypothetical protein
LAFAVEHSGKVVAGVGDGFNLRDNSKHPVYFALTFVRESSFAHFVEIVGYFEFHAVRDVLVLLDSFKQFDEFVLFEKEL